VGVAEVSDGKIWFSDAGAVFALDPVSGTVTHVAEFGEGPGQVDIPDRIARMPDRNMAVYDFCKVEVYSQPGSLFVAFFCPRR